MNDLSFNIDSMEVNISDGDFAMTNNPSTQNGGLILYSKNTVLRRPNLGIGIMNAINANQGTVVSNLNRWKQQTLQDGAISANYTNTNPIEVNCAYQ